MSNINCIITSTASSSSIDGNRNGMVCNDLLISNRAETLLMNRQMQMMDTTALPSNSRSQWRNKDFSIATHRNGNANSFINGDLIDLCDSTNEHLSGSSRDYIEAINSQLLTAINGNAEPTQAIRDCYVLYPTKVSFDNNKLISGTKLNHTTKKMNNSVDLSSSTRSSEAIGKFSESNGCTITSTPTAAPTTTNEQHQTVIREFKRLGTYCTLRPEQRRKHLLKVLPTLRSSMLLQTILGSNPNCTKATTTVASKNLSKITTTDELLATNKDIDSLLIDLDDFIIVGNKAYMQRHNNNEQQQQHFTSSESFGSNCDNQSQTSLKNDATISYTCYTTATDSSDELSDGCIKIDPDKVEDCLLELDAYLEEIDRDYVLACAANGPNTSLATTTSTISRHNSNNTKISANPTNECSEKTSKKHIDRLLNMDNLLNCNDCVATTSSSSSLSSTGQINQMMMDNCIVNDARSIYNDGASNLRKQISNSNIQMNRCGNDDATTKINGIQNNIDNKRKSNDSCNMDQPLKRGHKLRNTVAVSGLNNRLNRSNTTIVGVTSTANTSTSSQSVGSKQTRERQKSTIVCEGNTPKPNS